jgi:hypothetical protein
VVNREHALTHRQACDSALSNAEYYEHNKTEQWNQTIIVRRQWPFTTICTSISTRQADPERAPQDNMLKALIQESTTSSSTPSYKFAVNSTIVQHVVPNSQVGKSGGSDDKSASGDKGLAGRRGMHSAMRAYWNEKTDGMWSFKYDGENKGLDVVVMVIWVAI